MNIQKRKLCNTNNKICSILFLALVLFGSSCRLKHKKTRTGVFTSAKFNESDFADALTETYSKTSLDTSNWEQKKNHSISDMMHYTYNAYEYLPLWLNENGNTDAAEAYLKDLDKVKEDGLDPEHYQLSSLIKELQQVKKSQQPDLNSLLALDTGLTISYLKVSHDLLLGAVVPKKADSLWFHANDSNWHPEHLLINTLCQNEVYPTLDSFRSRIPTYASLVKARQYYSRLPQDKKLLAAKQNLTNSAANDTDITYIIHAEVPWIKTEVDSGATILQSYQSYYGIKQTGKIDSVTKQYLSRAPEESINAIDVNLERLRWMKQDMEPLHVLVDIPLMELFLRKEGKDLMHMRVVVGKTVRQTPALNANMANIVINPPWGVPPTILKKDVLPGVQKSGAAYLAKKDLKVYDHKGKLVDPSIVNASNYKRFVFRQPPGDDNALGYVKFNLPNKWDIYLHDTPHRDLFAKDDRAQSSGCIRVQQPKEMAEFILAQLEGKQFTQGTLDSIIQTQKTRTVVLHNKIPVHIVYLTAMEDNNGHYRFIKDIYKRDNKLAALIKKDKSEF